MRYPGIGLDFLSAKPWSAKIIPGQRRIEQPKAFQSGLPTALLPLQNGEKPPTGQLADEHRRGRGLAWPPEAQVPPLSIHKNGSGRVPMCALFEMLCNGEEEWGNLVEPQLSWSPDGFTEVSISPSKLIALQVNSFKKDEQWIGLVVPDALGVGGQEALLKEVGKTNFVLVPRSIAAVIGYCRSSEALRSKGHITVIDTSFGAWSVAKIPVDIRKAPKGQDWYVPVSNSRLRRNKLSPTGWSILRKALSATTAETLTLGWAKEALSGALNLSHAGTGQSPSSLPSNYSWDKSLMGNPSLSEALQDLINSVKSVQCESEYQRNLGLMVIGPLAKCRFDGVALSDILQTRIGETLIQCAEESIATGAAWAAAGSANEWPTWLEKMELLELHYIGKDELENEENKWKEVLPEKLVDAGKDYRNGSPITGIKLNPETDKVSLYLRRPKDDATQSWIYREVCTMPAKPHAEEIKLQIEVCAKPGQGFAVVTVSSEIAGLFESELDWENMKERTEAPKPRPKGYIEKAVTLVPAPELWKDCSFNLEHLTDLLEKYKPEQDIIEACRQVVKHLNKALTSSNYKKKYRIDVINTDDFTLYTPMGRNPLLQQNKKTERRALIERTSTAMLKWIKRNPSDIDAIKWIKKVGGWWYLGCPKEFIQEAVEDFGSSPQQVHLEIVGRCLKADNLIIKFFRAFTHKMPDSTGPNNWMKALRNLIKFNEHCLRQADLDTVKLMFQQSLDRLRRAKDEGKNIIVINSLESLFFLLKYRRYDRDFISDQYERFEEPNRLGFEIFFSAVKKKFGGAESLNGWKLLLRKAVKQKGTTTLEPNDIRVIKEEIDAIEFDESSSSPFINTHKQKERLFLIGKHINKKLNKAGRFAFAFIQFLNREGDNDGLGEFLQSDDEDDDD